MTEDLAVKLVKVDNWGIFFLQRLQQLFSKGDFCDLTLKFKEDVKVKVHRLVVNACTEYFVALEKQGNLSDGCLQIPSDLHPDVVVPIINFMYTGRLEFREDLHKQLYSTAQQMNMTVLTKLLDAQAFPGQNIPKNVNKKNVPVTWNLQGKKIVPKRIDPDFPNPLPGRKLPIWKKRSAPPKLPAINTEPQPVNHTPEGPAPPPPKEVPRARDEPPRPTRFEWPEDDVEMSLYSTPFDNISYETSPLLQRPKETATPPPSAANTPVAKTVSFEELRKNMTVKRPLQSSTGEAPDAKKCKVVDLQEVKEYLQEHQLRKELIEDDDAASDDFDDSVAVADLDDDEDEDREVGHAVPVALISQQSVLQRQEEVNDQESVVVTEEIPSVPTEAQSSIHEMSTETNVIEGDATEENHQEADGEVKECAVDVDVKQQTTELKAAERKENKVVIKPQEVQKQPPDLSAAPQKSILKTPASKEGESTPNVPIKKVRFSLENDSEGKENVIIHHTQPPAPPPSQHEVSNGDEITHVIPTDATLTGGSSNINNLSNHAKIISEVLKKYPHLVKDNKNIRLKIMQKGHTKQAITVEGDSGKVVKSKVSYVVLKSNDSAIGKVILKHGTFSEPLSEVAAEGQKAPSGAENTTGPWLCYTCGTNEQPINFETYYSYRRHLQEIHQEKIDARICEHCGHKASKRNLLLYHLYTKHGVPPPRNCQFPKCDQCEYVALSESLLIKHRNNHLNAKDFLCKMCNASFKSNGALQGHMQTNLHSDPTKKTYECPYCQRPFMRNINLKAHIRAAHKEVAKKIEDGGGEKKQTETKPKKRRTKAQESKANAMDVKKEMHQALPPPLDGVIPNTECGMVGRMEENIPPPNLVPSSEAEALSNVASGIAASLGLADSLTEVPDHGVVQEDAQNKCDQYIYQQPPVNSSQQEYIVPEILDGGTVEVVHSYSGPLSELENYGGDNNNCALPHNNTAPVLMEETIMVSVANSLQGTHVMATADSLKPGQFPEGIAEVKGVVPLTVTTDTENTQIVHFAVPTTITETGQIVHLSVPSSIAESGHVVHLSVPTSIADATQMVQLSVPTTMAEIIEQSNGKVTSSYPIEEAVEVKCQGIPKLERQVLSVEVPQPSEEFENLPPVLVREVPIHGTQPPTIMVMENVPHAETVTVEQCQEVLIPSTSVSESAVINHEAISNMEPVATGAEESAPSVTSVINEPATSSDTTKLHSVKTELVRVVKREPSLSPQKIQKPTKQEPAKEVIVSKVESQKVAKPCDFDLVPKVTTSYPSPKKKMQLGVSASVPKDKPASSKDSPPKSTSSSSSDTKETTIVRTEKKQDSQAPAKQKMGTTENVTESSEHPAKSKPVPEKVKAVRVVRETKKT